MPKQHDIEFLCLPPSASLHEILRRQADAATHGLPAGVVLVVDEQRVLQGVVTDGDVRRAILRTGSLDLLASDAMKRDPITFPEGTTFQAILQALPTELAKRNFATRRFLGKIVLVDDQRRPTRVLHYHQLWEQRVATHRNVVVLGLGYVGQTLALGLAEEGFRVVGVDTDAENVALLAGGESRVHEVGLVELLREQLKQNFSVSTRVPDNGDVFVISVGTPVKRAADGTHQPDLTALVKAAEMVGERMQRGALVVLRSTVPLGATRQVVLPVLERISGLEGGTDFHLAFAPERTVEGNALAELRSLPQIVGGLNPDSVEATTALFRELARDIVRVESLEAAEMVKLVNNSFRDLIFAFANQVAQVAAPFNLSAHEVIRAANRGYPRDPIPRPSPGVGGLCLTKDPYILASVHKAKQTKTLFELGREVNENMHDMVVDAVLAQLRAAGKDVARSSILVCGLAFKGEPETSDVRMSSAVEIVERLRKHVGTIYGYDAAVKPDDIRKLGLQPVALPDGFAGKDAVLFLNNHRSFRKLDVFSMVRALAAPGIVFDGWDLFESDQILHACPSIYMGLGFVRSSVR